MDPSGPQATREESPFCATGLVYLRAQEFYDRRIPGGFRAVFGALEDPAVRAFFDRPFFATSWYDLLPIVPLSRTAADLARVSHQALVTENARAMARQDISTIYRFVLRVLSPEQAALRLPWATTRYFNFCEASAETVGEGRVRAVQRGLPESLVHWMTWAVDGFVNVALEMAGARRPRVVLKEPAAPAGTRGNVACCTLVWEITWEV